jgi:hypothetical protein
MSLLEFPMRRLLFLFLLIALPAHAGGGFLSADDIKDRLAAGDLAVKSSADYEFPVDMTLHADGTMEGVSGNGYFDVGRWWLRGDILCHKWDGWFDGLRKCYAVAGAGSALRLEKPSAEHFTSAKSRLK